MLQYLGQHFLKNKIKLQKIVEALDLKEGDAVIEIGPGHGELTEELIDKFKSLNPPAGGEKFRIIAIEKDKKFAENLKEKFKIDKNIDPVRSKTSKMSADLLKINRTSNGVEIIEGDALKVLPQIIQDCKLQTTNYKLVGNIPYYITGYLFRILGELKKKPSKIILLIQKEVAQRLCAPKYGQKMNLLALATQFYADLKILFYVLKGDFTPAPKVDSAVIEIIPRMILPKTDQKIFLKICRAGFSRKRKLLTSNLADNLKLPKEKIEKALESIGVNLKSRAEDLLINDWENLVLVLE
ncbi:ribosomal RNA small subunit methyltransferase A [Candidatus Wolfebacteria bacterium]|nr:ribosomal RNA small subunit methyltransferase A [Candidatus Wolfebacteria bacterium]